MSDSPASHDLPKPRAETRSEIIAAGAAEGLAGLLETAAPHDTLPALWHWAYLLDRPPQSTLGIDGHPTNAIAVPPPGGGYRRMFAGGRVTTYNDIRIGEYASRTTQLVSTTEKVGRSGQLRFVTVRDVIEQSGSVCVVEERDIVYRAPAVNRQGEPSGGSSLVHDESSPDAALGLDVDVTLLFRFSALTYNAHRIHYDREYARSEGYPDLVVHGPLQALLMAELLRRNDVTLVGRQFSYRLLAPIFGAQHIVATAKFGMAPTTTVRDGNGRLTATGQVTLQAPHQFSFS